MSETTTGAWDTTEEQPLEDAASDPEGGYDVDGTIDSIDGAIGTWVDIWDELFQQMAEPGVLVGSRPGSCYAVAEYNNWIVETGRALLVNAEMLARRAAEMGQARVREVVRTYGRAGQSQAIGVRPFTEDVFTELNLDDAAVVWNVLLPMGPGQLGGAALFDWVDDRLPIWQEGHLPPSSNRGYRLGPGWYLWAGPGRTTAEHQESGRFTGTAFRNTFLNWRSDMRANVVPGQHNQWRDLLYGLTGRSRDDWRIWVAGDPYQPESKLDQLEWTMEYLQLQVDELKIQCETAIQFQRDQIERATWLAGLQGILGASTGPVLALAGAAIGIALARRK
jgi:hypothetical protein